MAQARKRVESFLWISKKKGERKQFCPETFRKEKKNQIIGLFF